MVFTLASLTEENYQLVLEIFKKFEEFSIKDQKLSRNKRMQSRISKLDCKGSYFKPLRGLDSEIRKELLAKVRNEEMSFQELANASKYAKKMRDIKESFIRYVFIVLSLLTVVCIKLATIFGKLNCKEDLESIVNTQQGVLNTCKHTLMLSCIVCVYTIDNKLSDGI